MIIVQLVFNTFLFNKCTPALSLHIKGMFLQNAIEKARSPLNFNLDLGTINTLFSEDLSGLEDVFGFKRSLRYSGAVPLRTLKQTVQF